MTIKELVEQSHAMSRSKGWYDEPGDRNIPEMLALIHSEVSEALEDYRKSEHISTLNSIYYAPSGKPEGFAVELADVVIRLADLCGYLGIDLEEAVTVKAKYNATRPHRHGGKRA